MSPVLLHCQLIPTPLPSPPLQRLSHPYLQYCKDTPGGIDHGKYLSGWFLGADTNSIRRDNIEDFVAYGFCYKSRCVCSVVIIVSSMF